MIDDFKKKWNVTLLCTFTWRNAMGEAWNFSGWVETFLSPCHFCVAGGIVDQFLMNFNENFVEIFCDLVGVILYGMENMDVDGNFGQKWKL